MDHENSRNENEKSKYLLLITLLIMIFAISNTYASELQLKKIKDFRMTEHYQVYEFNNGYIKLSQYNIYDVVTLPADPQRHNNKMLLQNIVGTSQYDVGDFYDLEYSPNIRLNNLEFIDDKWRGTIYYCPRMKFEISDINEDAGTNSIWVAYKLKRLPHLHTRKKLILNEEFHLGINSAPSRGLKKCITIVAFPAGTELTEIFHNLPSRQENSNNWIFLIYDLSKIKVNVSSHVRFILHENSISELNINDLKQVMDIKD